MRPQGSYMLFVEGRFTDADYDKMLGDLRAQGKVHSTYFDEMGENLAAKALFNVSSRTEAEELLTMLRKNLGVQKVEDLNKLEKEREVVHGARH